MENVRNRTKVEFIKKDDTYKNIKQQSKSTFYGIHRSYENYDIFVIRKNEVVMDKPIYLGFTVLELSKLHKYETYYDKLQKYFGVEILNLQNMDTDSFILSVNAKDIVRDLKKLQGIFYFSKLDGHHELFINKNKKVIIKFKNGTPKNIWIDDFVCLRSKMYAFKCGDDSKNSLKGLSKSQSKKFIFGEFNRM